MDLKNFGKIVAKNAVNAVITNASLAALMHGEINTYSRNGLWNIGKVALATIVSREVVVWLPIVLKWSTTNADPGVQVIQTPPGQPNIVQPKPIEPKP